MACPGSSWVPHPTRKRVVVPGVNQRRACDQAKHNKIIVSNKKMINDNSNVNRWACVGASAGNDAGESRDESRDVQQQTAADVEGCSSTEKKTYAAVVKESLQGGESRTALTLLERL